jgi:hypothetical protein
MLLTQASSFWASDEEWDVEELAFLRIWVRRWRCKLWVHKCWARFQSPSCPTDAGPFKGHDKLLVEKGPPYVAFDRDQCQVWEVVPSEECALRSHWLRMGHTPPMCFVCIRSGLPCQTWRCWDETFQLILRFSWCLRTCNWDREVREGVPYILVRDDPVLSGDSGEVPIFKCSGWRFESCCEIFSLRWWIKVPRWVGSQVPTHRKVGSKPPPLPAPRGFLSTVRPTGSNSRWIARRWLFIYLFQYICALDNLMLVFGENIGVNRKNMGNYWGWIAVIDLCLSVARKSCRASLSFRHRHVLSLYD